MHSKKQRYAICLLCVGCPKCCICLVVVHTRAAQTQITNKQNMQHIWTNNAVLEAGGYVDRIPRYRYLTGPKGRFATSVVRVMAVGWLTPHRTPITLNSGP